MKKTISINSIKKCLAVAIIAIMSFLCLSACIPPLSAENDTTTEVNKSAIKLLFNNQEVIVDMYDNNSAKDFVSLLPLTIVFDDYNSAEKTADLPSGRRLNTTDAPSGYDPSAGELGYYSPWGNMVIYHQNFGYASGIVPLGKFRSGEEKFTAIKGAVSVRFEKVATA